MPHSDRYWIRNVTRAAGCAIAMSAALGASAQSTPAQPSQEKPAPTAPSNTTPSPANTPAAQAPAAKSTPRVTHPARDNLSKMMRLVTIDFTEQRLEDVIVFLQEFTGAEFEPEWRGDREDGLDKDRLLSLSVKNMTALAVLERVLAKVQTDYEENTWQMTPAGTIQFGPKNVLNREKRLVIYDINDLLTVLPRFTDAPTIDLEQVLQNNGGGGGGGSPFEEEDEDQEDLPTKQERAQSVIDLVVTTVEPEQWVDNGGSGGTIRYYNGTLIVNAPDYMHRQINGYSYWPSYTASKTDKGRRWVTLTGDTGISKVDGFAEEPVVVPRP